MSRRRRFSDKPFGETVHELMADTGITYRALAAKTHLSAGYLHHIVNDNRPVPATNVIATIAEALGVQAEHFREYRIRYITGQLEAKPELVDRLYKRLL